MRERKASPGIQKAEMGQWQRDDIRCRGCSVLSGALVLDRMLRNVEKVLSGHANSEGFLRAAALWLRPGDCPGLR